MMFLVDEWIGLDNISSLPGYEDLDRDSFEFILEEAGKFCTNELLPINRQGDEQGATHEGGAVTTPPGFKEAYQKYIEAGWTGIDGDPELGGQGLPKLMQYLVDEMLGATNLAFKLYSELSHGAYYLLSTFAPPEIRERYVPKMIAGVWSGTMCLTEPHCGTDLGLLTTKATDNGDGSYKINGSKIFITSGDQDLTENIVHLVLARIEGAPAGARGISVFLVPKFHVNEDGSIGDPNQVVTASIEHKMGIKGSATCALNFDDASGYLIGEENRGLAAMFKMMNTERITVGIQGLGFSEIAYQNALAYALERTQSKAPAPRPNDDKAADPIIYQPEVQRMLLHIRSQVEGARAMAVYAGYNVDVMEKSTDDDRKSDAANTVALFTPVVKAFMTDLGMSSTLSAQQVFGGHGYVREHGMEQLVRDCRITPIYEGTNEVQAADLVMRKMSGETGEFADRLFAEWRDELEAHKNDSDSIVAALASLDQLEEATTWLRQKLADDEVAARGAATAYLRLFALSSIACFWSQILIAIRDKSGVFYDTKRKTARFYMQHVLPETVALQQIITEGSESLRDFSVGDFTGQS